MLACTLVGALVLAGLPGNVPQESGFDSAAISTFATEPTSDALAELEAKLAADRMVEAAWLKQVALALGGEPGSDVRPLQQELAAIMRRRGERLAAHDPSWPEAQVNALLALLQIDPRRFSHDSDFRHNVLPVMRDGVSPAVPREVRTRMARKLGGLEFGPAERLLVAWGLAPRNSRDREVLFGSWPVQVGSMAQVHASIYSLPSRYFRFEEAARFLRGMHRVAPQRDLVVLSDAPLVDELHSLTSELPLYLIDSFSRRYTPWPRDPFMVLNNPQGAVRLLVRPNIQARREGDVSMAREVIRGLPPQLDVAWGRPQWSAAPVPFHGGHTLAIPGSTWASVHTLLPRIVEIMGEYPTLASLRRSWTRARFVDALEAAREEFEAVFVQPLRFVHAVPQAAGAEMVDFEEMLVGGGTSDLDSLVAILPGANGRSIALVGDFALGNELLSVAPSNDLRVFGDTYHLDPADEPLRRALLQQEVTRTNELIGDFLDSTADHLRGEGLEVHRLPLLHVPEAIVDDEFRRTADGFLVTWANVVLEEVDGARFAEGFASGLASVDETVRDTFAAAGYELRLVPTLAFSVMRDGGYRCASNHVR